MQKQGGLMMIINLYNNESAPNVINKQITLLLTLNGTLRGEANVVSPTIRIFATSLPAFNYAYIPEFGRYYYLRDMQIVRNEIIDLSLKSDPLKSFNLNSITGIISEAQNIGNNYIEHRHFVRSVKSKTDILPFGSGLLDSGEYILITAGGGAS